jgi:hypothetical protein
MSCRVRLTCSYVQSESKSLDIYRLKHRHEAIMRLTFLLG